jgi:hypothetical protein
MRKKKKNARGSSGAATTCRKSGHGLKECQFAIIIRGTRKNNSN